MRLLLTGFLGIWVLLGAGLAGAATEVSVDWQSGEVEVKKEASPAPVAPAQTMPLEDCERENRRLQGIVRAQQAIILQQQDKLREQQAVIRRQSDVLRGLDLLRRQGR